MIRHFYPFLGIALAALVHAPLCRADADRTLAGARTALDRYVAAPDPSYAWKRVSSKQVEGASFDVIELTSQTWLTAAEVNKPAWKHWLTVIRPEKVSRETALLFIGGGSNEKPAPEKPEAQLLHIAKVTESVVVELKGVPSEPLLFTGESNTRTEDEIIAYTWDKYLRTGDEKWPLRLPMTKAAVRAMDTVTAYCSSPEGGGKKVDKFFVSGASKRGWTTWSTAAADKRVIAIAPIVIDVLNVGETLKNHWNAYGFWAPAVGAYSDMKLMDWYGQPEFDKLMKIEDPWEYRSRYTLPKFMINATGDQFFPPDSSKLYFSGLPGVKYLRYVPNADHGLKGSDAWFSLLSFYEAILNGSPLPQFDWKRDGTRLAVTCQSAPSQVLLWQATNEKARDFRMESLGAKWESTPLQADAENKLRYTAAPVAPAAGWTAWFVELTFDSGGSAPWKFTTEVQISPDTFPHTFVPAEAPPAPLPPR